MEWRFSMWNRNLPGYPAVLVLVLSFAAALAGAAPQAIVFEQGSSGYEGMQDTSIFSESENSGGGTDGIFAGTTLQLVIRRALLRADLTSLPPGTTVLGVTLELTVDRSGGNLGDSPFTLHRLNQDWGEGTVDGPSAGGFGGAPDSGDATWSFNFFNSSPWDSPGADFVSTASAEANAGQAGSVAMWTSQGLAADVQRWLDDPSSNFGWLIKSTQEGEQQIVKRFRSSQASSSRPKLVVTIEVPSPSPADINGDGNLDAVDVQLVINAALDIDIGGLDADIDGDGLIDAVDVQLMINAALGI